MKNFIICVLIAVLFFGGGVWTTVNYDIGYMIEEEEEIQETVEEAVEEERTDFDLKDWMYSRTEYVNKRMVDNHSSLSRWDAASRDQIKNRVDSIFEAAKKYNDVFPDVHYRRVAKDFFAIIEYETSFVNFASLDNGDSFGVISMDWDTAVSLAEELGISTDRDYLLSNPEVQIELGVYYYYKMLDEFEDRHKAITAYNTGPNITFGEQRNWPYLFRVLGRMSYHESEWEEKGAFA